MPRLQLASQLEEAMLQVLRQVEVSVDSAVSVLTRGFPSGAGTASDTVEQKVSLPGHCPHERPCCMQTLVPASTVASPRMCQHQRCHQLKYAAECKLTCLQAAKQDAAELIDEVYQVVADNYLDARDGGFDKSRCAGALPHSCFPLAMADLPRTPGKGWAFEAHWADLNLLVACQ